ncbi:TPA: Ig-like domain-containing protein [Vibrio parahaemolyticus]
MIAFKRFFAYFLLTLLVSCGGDSGGENDANISQTISPPIAAENYSQLLLNDDSSTVSLADSVKDPQGLPLSLVSVEPLTEGCDSPQVDSAPDALSFSVVKESPSVCFYQYTVKNTPDDTTKEQMESSYSYVLVSETRTSAVLPALSASTTIDSGEIDIDIKAGLASSYPDDYTLDLVFLLGEGSAVIKDGINGVFTYTPDSSSKGINRVMYSLKASDGSDVKVGYVDIAVSGEGNIMPVAEDFQGPEDVPLDTKISIDVSDYISDADEDDLQLTDAYAFNAEVSATDPTSVKNTSFDFQASEPGRYDVSYYIYDHRNGYAVGTVRITVLGPEAPWDDIVLESNGELYTAPWEQYGADSYNIPYQSLVDENIGGVDYNIPLFNFSTASYLCNIRGMLLPSLTQLDTLLGERGDVNTSDNWPVADYYWSSDSVGVDLSGIKEQVSLESSDVAIVTCVYPGTLLVDTITDGAFTTDEIVDEPGTYNELEATVVNAADDGMAGKQLYAYSASGDVVISPSNALTSDDGKANFKVRSSTPGMFDVTIKYLTQTIDTTLEFIEDIITDYWISPSSIEVEVDADEQAQAYVVYSSTPEGDSVDVTNSSTWSITDGSDFASVNTTGLITGLAEGEAVVTAYFGDESATATIVVVSPSVDVKDLTVDPSTSNIAVGETVTLTAYATVDGTPSTPVEVKWALNNLGGEIAFDGYSDGVSTSVTVVGVATGGAQVAAQYDGGMPVLASVTVTEPEPDVTLESIEISPDPFSVCTGSDNVFTAVGHYSDDTSNPVDATWSLLPGFDKVNPGTGSSVTVTAGPDVTLSTGIGASFGGESTIATGEIITCSTEDVVTDLRIDPDNKSVSVGETQTFTAYANVNGIEKTVDANWLDSSANFDLNSTSGKTVNLTGLSAGSGTLYAAYGSGDDALLAEASITVTKETTGVASGLRIAPNDVNLTIGGASSLLTAYATIDGTEQKVNVTWYKTVSTYSISSPSGETTIVTGVSETGADGDTLMAVYGSGTSNELVATAVIKVASASATMTSIEIVPNPVEVEAGGAPTSASVIAYYSDGTFGTVTPDEWVMGDSSIAMVSDAGLVTGLVAGSTTLTANYGTSLTDSALVMVSEDTPDVTVTSVTVDPSTWSVTAGEAKAFAATAHYSDGTSDVVTDSATWSTSSTTVATVNTTGYVTAQSAGSATISATYEGVKGTSSVTVTDSSKYSSLAVNPDPLILTKGSTGEVYTLADGSELVSYNELSWNEGNMSVASVVGQGSSAVYTKIIGNSTGTNTMVVSAGGTSANLDVNVLDKGVDDAFYEPDNVQLHLSPSVTTQCVTPYYHRTGLGDVKIPASDIYKWEWTINETSCSGSQCDVTNSDKLGGALGTMTFDDDGYPCVKPNREATSADGSGGWTAATISTRLVAYIKYPSGSLWPLDDDSSDYSTPAATFHMPAK